MEKERAEGAHAAQAVKLGEEHKRPRDACKSGFVLCAGILVLMDAQAKRRDLTVNFSAVICWWSTPSNARLTTQRCASLLNAVCFEVHTRVVSGPFPAREEQERGNEGPDTTAYRHVAHLWQNWLPPKAMTTLEKGENNSSVQYGGEEGRQAGKHGMRN